MDYREIRLLLDKFYNGHTTCLEEKSLYEWLSSDKCPEELFTDREIVRAYVQQHPSVDIPEKLELKMELLVDKWMDAEHQSIHKKVYLKWKYIAGVAAMVTFIIGTAIYFHSSSKGVYVDTCQTPEEAYVEVQKALSLISETMQKGMEPIVDN